MLGPAATPLHGREDLGHFLHHNRLTYDIYSTLANDDSPCRIAFFPPSDDFVFFPVWPAPAAPAHVAGKKQRREKVAVMRDGATVENRLRSWRGPELAEADFSPREPADSGFFSRQCVREMSHLFPSKNEGREGDFVRSSATS